MKKIASAIIILLSIFDSIFAGNLKVGASWAIITPDPLLPVSGGVGIPNVATVKKGELTTRAIVLQKDGVKLAIVAIDNLGVPGIIGDRIRKLVPNIPPENILIGVSHTHSAPDLYGFADKDGNTGLDLNYVNFVVEKTAETIHAAESNLQECQLKIAVDEAKGKIAYNAYAPKLYDPRCGVIQFISKKDSKPVVTLLNYAIHPEVIGSDRGICTPDLVGPLYRRIESKIGGMAIFMNSAQGGMVTADNRLENGKEKNDWDECIRIGELLADEALRIVQDAPVQEDPRIKIIGKNITLPIESELMKTILKYSVLEYNLSDDSEVTTLMNLVTIGTAKILTIPGEALPNIGFYLKRKMNSAHPFLFGLTNDAYGYILTKEDFGSFKTYNYITRTSLGENTGEIIINSALNLIDKDFDKL